MSANISKQNNEYCLRAHLVPTLLLHLLTLLPLHLACILAIFLLLLALHTVYQVIGVHGALAEKET